MNVNVDQEKEEARKAIEILTTATVELEWTIYYGFVALVKVLYYIATILRARL